MTTIISLCSPGHIIAFKGMVLAKAAASHPDEDWIQVLSHEAWPTLYRNVHQTLAIPTKPTRVLQAITGLASRGGFPNQKSDQFPGRLSLG